MIQFGERKILTANFSVDEMNSLTDDAEKRKYFILRYFLPLAYTRWQEWPEEPDIMLLHICRVRPSARPHYTYFPYLSGARENYRIAAYSDIELFEVTHYNDDVAARALGTVPAVAHLSSAIEAAFGGCFPLELPTYNKLSTSPLVASLIKTPARRGGHTLKLNVVAKHSSWIRRDSLYLNQGHSSESEHILAISDKYERAYNRLTGKWYPLCEEGSDCAECQKIYNSPARENAYDDEELH